MSDNAYKFIWFKDSDNAYYWQLVTNNDEQTLVAIGRKCDSEGDVHHSMNQVCDVTCKTPREPLGGV